LGRVQECGDYSFFVKAALRCEGQSIDATKLVVLTFTHELLNGGDHVGIG
jgi:hypothetical protein